MNRRPPMDWRDPSVTRHQAMRDLDQYAWAPRPMVNFNVFGWSIAVVMLCTALLGLMAIGK